MKRRGLAWLLAVLLLAGCVQKPTTEPPTAEPTETPPVETQDETPPEVENNGGSYVRVGDTVYFRRNGARQSDKTAVYGDFTSLWSDGGESELMAYDTASGALTALCTETGAGALWYGDGGFYLCEYANGEPYTAWYAPDGSAVEYLCPGAPLGVTEGGLLAVSRFDASTGYNTVYTFYRDKTAVGSWESEDYLMTAGLTDDGLFLVGTDYNYEEETVTQSFRQITPEGAEIFLGERSDHDAERYYTDIEPDRFLSADGVVTIGLGCYAGSGHFLSDAVFVEATVGRANSLKTLEQRVEDILGTDEIWQLPYFRAGEDGVEYLAEREGALQVSGENAALELWENGAWQTLAEGFAPSRGDGWGFGTIVQNMDYVDGAAYVTLANAFAAPGEDIGWREANTLLALRYLRVTRDGTVTELSRVDYGAEIFGFVWFVEGESCALWQQLTSEDGEGWFDVPYVYAVPIAEDAEWDPLAFDGVKGLLPYDYGEGEADYYGYPVPDAEPAGELTLVLDGDGNATAILRKDPAAALTIDFDVPESAAAGATATFPLERRDRDEDTPWFWTLLTALEDVHVVLERTPAETGEIESEALEAGLFVAGEALFNGTLRRGETIALRASLPWHPELRVTVDKNGAVGSYVFGEDNYLRLETEVSPHPGITLATYPLPDPQEYSGEGLREALSGAWLYRPNDDGEATALLFFGDDGTVSLTRAGVTETALMDSALDRLYAAEHQAPDLLCLRSDDPVVLNAMGFAAGGVGDYRVELYRTDGEELLRLTQANNGDGALGALLPDEDGAWRYDFTFTRARGASETGSRRYGMSFPAIVARYDAASGVCWLREAECIESEPSVGDVWRAAYGAPCLSYHIAPDAASGLGARPMALRRVTTDGSGAITKLEPIE